MAKATTVKNRHVVTLQDVANMEFGAALTKKKMEKLERHAQLPDHGINRRVGLAVLTRTKTQLVDTGDGETLMNIYDCLSGYVEHLEGKLELMRSAKMRVLSAVTALMPRQPSNGADTDNVAPVARRTLGRPPTT